MAALEKMPGHTRLYRRGAVYDHRAAVPQDIVETCGKVEETFSPWTRDRAETLIDVRFAAAQVDDRFAEHRRQLEGMKGIRLPEAKPPAAELNPE